VGAGAAGRAVGIFLAKSGLEAAWIADPALAGQSFLGLTLRGDAGALSDVDLLVLAVPDEKIAATARELCATAPTTEIPALPDSEIPAGARASNRPVAVHLGAATPVAALDPLKELGFETGLLHPMMSFPCAAGRLDQVSEAEAHLPFWGVAGTPAAREYLARLLSGKGLSWIELEEDQQLPYHVCGVLASNFLPALLQAASGLWPGSDEGTMLEALAPIMRRTLENATSRGIRDSLSGPLHRGDAGTVHRHLDWLEAQDPRAARLYRLCCELLLELLGEQTPASPDSSLDAWIRRHEAPDEEKDGNE